MNQGMVASNIGIITNTSAHTSYLYLVKQLYPYKQNPRLNPLGSPRRTIQFQNLNPVLVGPPIIY